MLSAMPSPENKRPSGPSAAHDFRTTHWSVVVLAGQGESAEASAALEKLCRAYWPPLYAYVRGRGYDRHQAQDLTQAFFAQLLEKKHLALADRERGRFRNFLLASLNHFLANEWNRERAQKRGGGGEFVSLDAVLEQEDRPMELSHDLTPERLYERRWAEALLAQVLARLRGEFDGAKVKRFDALKIFLTEEKGAASYAEAAAQLGLTDQAVKSAIHRLRQRYRELLREEIAHTVATPQEVDEEIRHLIEVLA